MRHIRFASTSLAVCATVALGAGTPAAIAAPGAPTPAKTAPSGSVAVRGVPIPAFPGLNASDAQLETWARAVATTYHLPAPPSDFSSDAQKMAYVQRVLTALGAPSQNASEAQWSAWLTKMAKSLGLPTPPPASAGQEAWVEWLQNALGVDIDALLDGIGADAVLGGAYCTPSGGRVAVSAINVGSAPAMLKPFLDKHPLKATISLAGTSKTAVEPVTYNGTISVPNGRHIVSLVDSASGETLDSATTHLACRVNAGASAAPRLTTKPTTKAPLHASSAKAAGPLVETDHVAPEASTTSAAEIAFAGALALSAVVVGVRRRARR